LVSPAGRESETIKGEQKSKLRPQSESYVAQSMGRSSREWQKTHFTVKKKILNTNKKGKGGREEKEKQNLIRTVKKHKNEQTREKHTKRLLVFQKSRLEGIGGRSASSKRAGDWKKNP